MTGNEHAENESKLFMCFYLILLIGTIGIGAFEFFKYLALSFTDAVSR